MYVGISLKAQLKDHLAQAEDSSARIAQLLGKGINSHVTRINGDYEINVHVVPAGEENAGALTVYAYGYAREINAEGIKAYLEQSLGEYVSSERLSCEMYHDDDTEHNEGAFERESFNLLAPTIADKGLRAEGELDESSQPSR